MKCVVCISQTPDTATKINVAADGKSIDPAGVKFILNPYDEFALEEAIRTKEKSGGEVIAITVGGDTAKDILRTALAMGADQAILIKDATRGDSFGVAQQLADVIKPMNADIVFCGRQSVDYDGFQIGPMLGELLGIPAVSIVVKMEIADTAVKCECEIEGGRQRIETTLPCVITAQKGLNDPRYPSLPNIMKAKSKPITEIAGNAPAARTQVAAMRKPDAKRLHKIFVAESDPNAVKELVQLLHEEAKVI
ncbi:MAG TPA: electron transfer flavoprotein subunit beta/FixA family protein [Candidatus Kapabacteria bacterium]|nr:electron transfer flavoprotein subunit beta/FixA family protein [Candidatus Kapabacteria bacterium]